MDALGSPLDSTLAQSTATAPRLSHTDDPAKARQAGEEFEAFFLSQMVEHMYSGLDPDALFGGGESENVYRSLLFQEYGKALAHGGGVGSAAANSSTITPIQLICGARFCCVTGVSQWTMTPAMNAVTTM